MKLTSLDKIVRSAITTKGFTIHYYGLFLHLAIRCLREINLDIIRNIHTVILPVDSNSNVTLPCDYVDYVRIGYMGGQYVIDMTQKTSLNRLPSYNIAGQVVPYPNIYNVPLDLQNTFPYNLLGWGGYGPYYYFLNTNGYGESYDGYYGYKSPQLQSFKVILEQNRIQLDQNSQVTQLYLEYITDGFDAGTASCVSMVSTYAIDTIEKYILLQFAKFNEGKAMNLQEVGLLQRDYELAVIHLASRLTPLSAADIRAAFRTGYGATAKGF